MRFVIKALPSERPLIPLKRPVNRKGRTHLQTYWVSPAEAPQEHKGPAPKALEALKELSRIDQAIRMPVQAHLDTYNRLMERYDFLTDQMSKGIPSPDIEQAASRVWAEADKAYKAYQKAESRYYQKAEGLRQMAHAAMLSQSKGKLRLKGIIASHPDVQEAADFIARLFPRIDLEVLMDVDTMPNHIAATAAFRGGKPKITVSGGEKGIRVGTGTLVHELGHIVEMASDELVSLTNSYFADRTQGKELANASWYDYYEGAFPYSQYMGHSTGGEVISCLVEGLYHDPMRLLERDPAVVEWFFGLKDHIQYGSAKWFDPSTAAD